MSKTQTATPKPTPAQLVLAAKAAPHLRNRLGEPRFASLFDGLTFWPEQSECLLALADVGAFYVEHQARMSSGGRKGGSAKSEKKTLAVRQNAKGSRKTDAELTPDAFYKRARAAKVDGLVGTADEWRVKARDAMNRKREQARAKK